VGKAVARAAADRAPGVRVHAAALLEACAAHSADGFSTGRPFTSVKLTTVLTVATKALDDDVPAVRAAFARALGRALALSVRWGVVERERARRAREAAKREEGSDDDGDGGGGGREKRKSGKGGKADGKGTPAGGDGGKGTPTGADHGGKGKRDAKKKGGSRWKKKKKKGKEEEAAFTMQAAAAHLEALFAKAHGRANRVAVAQAYVALLRAANAQNRAARAELDRAARAAALGGPGACPPGLGVANGPGDPDALPPGLARGEGLADGDVRDAAASAFRLLRPMAQDTAHKVAPAVATPAEAACTAACVGHVLRCGLDPCLSERQKVALARLLLAYAARENCSMICISSNVLAELTK